MNAALPSCSRRSPRAIGVAGFTLVEVLVAVAIAAVLLVGLAAATNAATSSMRKNQDLARSNHAARAALDRMLAEARTCAEPIVTSTSLNLKPENYDEKRTYAYDAANRQLTMTVHQNLIDVPNPVAVVARDVSSAAFRSDGRTVSITLVVGSGDTAVTLSGSVTPRRFLTYQ